MSYRPGDEYVYKTHPAAPTIEVNPVQHVVVVEQISTQRVRVRFDDGRQDVIHRSHLVVGWQDRHQILDYRGV